MLTLCQEVVFAPQLGANRCYAIEDGLGLCSVTYARSAVWISDDSFAGWFDLQGEHDFAIWTRANEKLALAKIRCHLVDHCDRHRLNLKIMFKVNCTAETGTRGESGE